MLFLNQKNSIQLVNNIILSYNHLLKSLSMMIRKNCIHFDIKGTNILFDSDKEPKPEDFSVMGGGIDTPEGEWDFISRFFFKDKLLEIDDWLDNSGKSTTMEIYTQDGRVIK